MLSLLILASIAGGDPVLDACMAKAVTDPEFSECTGSAIERADTLLNQRWRTVMKLMKADYTRRDRDALLAEQRAWITFKDKSCLFYWNQPSFGSLHRTIIGPSCRLQIINERIADLENIIIALSPEGSAVQPRESGPTKE